MSSSLGCNPAPPEAATLYDQVVDVSEGTPQVMKYPRKGSFEVSYMLREEGRTFAKEVS